jgi:hypothetical protein
MVTHDELRVITVEAFNLLIFWVNEGEIAIDFFERFMAILVQFKDKISCPLEPNALPGMIEMMSVVNFKDHAIYTTLEIYAQSPDFLRNQFSAIH